MNDVLYLSISLIALILIAAWAFARFSKAKRGDVLPPPDKSALRRRDDRH